MDYLDRKILDLLKKNSKMTNKEIGSIVHLTGQAVSQRILSLEEKKIIEKFTIKEYHALQQFISIHMENNQFTLLEEAVLQFDAVEAFFKVSGHACYMVVAHFDIASLNIFVDTISKWARCSVDQVIRPLK